MDMFQKPLVLNCEVDSMEKNMKNIEEYIINEINEISDNETNAIEDEYKNLKQDALNRVIKELEYSCEQEANNRIKEQDKNYSKEKAEYSAFVYKQLFDKRNEYVDMIFNKVKEELLNDINYKESLADKIVLELSKYQLDEPIVYVKEEDLQYIKNVKMKVHARKNIQLGGFVIESNNGKIIDKTLDTILEEQRQWFYENAKFALE